MLGVVAGEFCIGLLLREIDKPSGIGASSSQPRRLAWSSQHLSGQIIQSGFDMLAIIILHHLSIKHSHANMLRTSWLALLQDPKQIPKEASILRLRCP